MMPEEPSAIQQALLGLFAQQQTQNTPTLNTGLLAKDQQGIGDVFTKPDQAQINAAIGAAAGLLNPTAGQPGLTALTNAGGQFINTRRQEFGNKVALEKLRQDTLQNQIQSALGIANLGISEGNLGVSQSNLKINQADQQLKQEKFGFEKSKVDTAGSFEIPGLGSRRGFISADGTPFAFVGQEGKAVNVAGKGLRFNRDKTSTQSINVGGNSFDKELSKRFAEQLVTNFDAVQGTVTSLPSVIEADRIINDPNQDVFTGPAANILTTMGGLLSSAGFQAAEDPTANTQAFTSLMGQDVLNILSSGALGAGTGISDKDKEFAANIVAGNVKLDRAAISRIMKINKGIKREVILEHNRRIDRVKGNLPVDLRIAMPPYLMTKKEKIEIMER
jgi:hypothetical protein